MPIATIRKGYAESGSSHNPGSNAQFSTQWLPPAVAVVTVHGELDAANTPQFLHYTLHHLTHCKGLALDLSGVHFLGTAGYSALMTLGAQCANHSVDWKLVPSAAVTRLLKVCGPDHGLPVERSADEALSALHGEPARLLQLVTKAR